MARCVPAVTVQALLEGFRRLGLDERHLRAHAGVPEGALAGASLVPDAVRRRLLAAAGRAARRDGLAIEAGLALPFGALGPMDYLRRRLRRGPLRAGSARRGAANGAASLARFALPRSAPRP
jgi:hypothetical protein